MQVQTIKISNRLGTKGLLEKRMELKQIIEESEKLLDQVNATLMSAVENDGIDGKLVVDNKVITLIKKPVFRNVTLAIARKFGATKMTVDTTQLSALLKEGAEVEGVTYSQYITVKA